MNVQAQMSGQVPSQAGPQMPGLSQQNVGSLPPQMQIPGAVGNMDHDTLLQRRQMREKITQMFQRRGSSAEITQRLPDIVKRLEDGLYRTAATKEDYLNMDTLESRIHSMLRANQNQSLGRHVSSSSSVSTMIPTPGMSHGNSSNLAVPSSLDNSMTVTSGSGNVESTAVNMGSITPSANGISGTGHGGSFMMPDGSLTNGYQHPHANMSIGSGGNNMLSSIPRLSSQMIPTPGLNIPKSMSINSATTSGGGFSSVESAIISQQQQQKQYFGNQSGRMLHGLGTQMSIGLRPNVQQRPSHGLSNGVANGGGVTLIGNNIQLMNGPTASEGCLNTSSYGGSPRTLQQHFDQQRHQTIITTSSSQQKVPVSGDGYGMNTSDLSGSGSLYSSATMGSTISNQNIYSTSVQSKSKMNTLQDHQQTLQSMPQISHKPPPFEHSQSLNFQSIHSTQEHPQPQQQMQTFQHQQQFQQQSVQPYGQFVQHQQPQNQSQQHQLYMMKNDAVRQPSLMSGLGGQVISEHGVDTFHESLLQQTPEQFHFSELHNHYQSNVTAETNPKATLGHFSVSQDFHPAFSQGPQQVHQILHSHNQGSQLQNELNRLSTVSQPETLLQNQWHAQSLQKSHTLGKSSFEQHIQDDFHQRIAGQDEAQRPHFPSDGSITGAVAAAASLTAPQLASGVGRGPGNSLRERQYFNQRRWLLFLHHARWCPAPKGKCQEVNCITVQKLLSHMRSCKEDQCGYPRCPQSKDLLKHYRSCQARDCPVCVPVHVYVSSHHKESIHPPDALCLNPLHVSWKTMNGPGADRPIQNHCLSSIEASEDQSSLKRRKVEHSSSLMSKSESSPAAGTLVDPSHTSKDVQVLVHQEVDMPLSTKPEIVDVKAEPSSACGLENPPNFTHVSMDDFEDVNVSRHTDSVLQNEHDGYPKTESMQINVDTDQIAVDIKQEVGTRTADPVTGSKSGKPKIKGVSLTELFTPEQIREHIISLRQWVGQSKAKAEKNQAMERSMNENSCQLCAVEKLTFEPPPIYCSVCGARIKRNAPYYTIGLGDTRHYFCIPCYNEARGDSIEAEGTPHPKAKLEKKKNDDEAEEWWVQCDKCEAWQHQICALFNGRRNDGGQAEYTCPNCYVQEIERGERMPLPQSAVLGAKDLPRTILSDQIEQRLFRQLKQEKQERARHLGKSVDEVLGAESLVVRVVSSVDKKLDVKQRFLEIFQEENYPTEFPYKSKVILLFQKIEGVEVCLFGMYVQEFGSESQFPNQRRVYLSYLDSVKYFRPEIKTITGEALRTFVYHEILIGYLEYCKKRGFTSCYIWACPPLKGEDYILYCHPEIQKTPKSDKLREWYLAMLRKASKENIVVDLTNLYDHFFIQMGECKAKVTAARLPYFDGDYWPGAAEDLINQLQQEEDGRKQQKKGKTKKTITKRALKAAGQTDLSGNASKDALLMQKLGETIFPMKEDFIMVHLQHACTHCGMLMVSGLQWVCNQCKNFQLCDKCYDVEQNLDEKERHPINAREKHLLSPVEINDVPLDTKDKDEILESEFFDTRQAFLSLCQGNHYQYDTLRRAKHSSMMVLYHLHNPTAPAFVITCNVCHRDIETGQGWRCEICPDFDVCNDCYQREGGVSHPHRLTNHPSTADRDAQNKEARQKRVLQLRKMLDLLVHASQCRSVHCQYPNCRKVKGLFRHGMQCRTRASGGCVLCKKMWYLLQLHARACKESECHVPRCKDLRDHLKRLQQQSDSRRRAAVMEMMRQRTAEVAGNAG